jgi:hypothetical protein
MAVGGSTLEALVLAAHLRAIERLKLHPRRAAIIGCTVSSAQYLDCLVPLVDSAVRSTCRGRRVRCMRVLTDGGASRFCQPWLSARREYIDSA